MARLARARSRHRERGVTGTAGQSMVEFGLVLPIIILIFVGVVDLSRLYHAYISATNAARVGAEAAMNRTEDNRVRELVWGEAAPSVALTSIVISPTAWLRAPGTMTEIRVTYVFSPYTPLVSSFWGGGSLSLVAKATARVY